MGKKPALQEFLTPGEAAKLIGCGSQRIRDLDRAGELVAAGKTVGGWRLFTRKSVETYLAKRRGKPRVGAVESA